MATPTLPAQPPEGTVPVAAGTPPVDSTRRQASRVRARETTFRRVLHTEWIKIRTLRSTWATALATVATIVGFGVLSALVASGEMSTGPGGGPPSGAAGSTGPLSTVLAGANPAVLIITVLGSVVGAREFGTGMIRTTFSAVPERLPVLWGKLLAFAGVVVPAVAVGVLGAFVAGMAVLHANGAATVAWTDPGVARALLGEVFNIAGLGVIGLALGILLRGTAAAIGTVIRAVLFVPTLASALLPESWNSVLTYLPSNAATAFTSLDPSGDSLLTPGAGALVFGAWMVLAVVAAAWALQRRDV